MKIALYNHPIEGICVTYFAKIVEENDEGERIERDPTEAEMLAELTHTNTLHNGLENAAILPTDEIGTVFFGALVYDPEQHNLTYDLPKAVQIKMALLRQMREALFVDVDNRRRIASDNNDTEELANVARQASELRDMPSVAGPVLAAYTSIAQIHTYVPDIFAELITE